MEKPYESRELRRIRAEIREAQIERFGVDPRAVLFNGLRNLPNDQDAILGIYKEKKSKGEFPEEIQEDPVKCIESVAQDYISQKCAFQDVLTKKGFSPTQEIKIDDNVRVAYFSRGGTVGIFSRPKSDGGRIFTFTRIHKPEFNDLNGKRCYVDHGFSIGDVISLTSPGMHGYKSSCVKGLAFNPNGADNDELEVRASQTMLNLICETYKGCMSLSSKKLLEFDYVQNRKPHL